MPTVIDLRSDTVTHPTDAMRRAMATTPLGDDVFGEDPTVNELEARAAALLGKEAGLFVASGSMGNLVSLMAHLPRRPSAVVGVVGYRPGAEASLPTAHLMWLAVRPRWQRQGVGRLLVETVERQCYAAGVRRLELDTLPSWEVVVAFYRALGFVAEV